MELREVTLPSGAVLKMNPAPFEVSFDLLQALLQEMNDINVTAETQYAEIHKQLLCRGFASKVIQAKLQKCFESCLYDDLHIDKKTFEPVAARKDYMLVCAEVATENVAPFIESLSAAFLVMYQKTETAQK